MDTEEDLLEDEESAEPTYGSELSEEILELNTESEVKQEWNFELTGAPVVYHEDDELLDYMIPGQIYIVIQSFDTNSSELIEFTFYRFQIYRNGFQNKNGYLTNEIGYTDPVDCLNAAIAFIKLNWDLIVNTYSDNLNDDLIEAGITPEMYQEFISNPPEYIPDEVHEVNLEEITQDTLNLLDRVKTHRKIIFKI